MALGRIVTCFVARGTVQGAFDVLFATVTIPGPEKICFGILVSPMSINSKLRDHDAACHVLIFIQCVKNIETLSFVVTFTTAFSGFMHLIFANVLASIFFFVAVSNLGDTVMCQPLLAVQV